MQFLFQRQLGSSGERFHGAISPLKAKGVWRRDILRLSPRHVELRFKPNVQYSEQAVRDVVWQLLRLRRVAEDNLEFTQVRPFVMTVCQNWTIGL